MRLLEVKACGDFNLTDFSRNSLPPYAILSHTWGADDEEVTFKDLVDHTGKNKAGYDKIKFCGERAALDNLKFFWVDTCCIDKSSSTELTEAINSMFRWYQEAARCYVYLSDVSTYDFDKADRHSLSAFRQCRWFTRGWTLQELIAPASVEFFSREGKQLGDKKCLEKEIHKITGIAVQALRGDPLSSFSIEDRMSWATKRATAREEDKAYCLLGIFDIHMPLIYGEGKRAFVRLHKEIRESSKGQFTTFSSRLNPSSLDLDSPGHGNVHWVVPRAVNGLFTGRIELLLRMQKALHDDHTSITSKQKRFVITGLGGQGKSEICLKVANLMREEFWGVFWIDVSSPSVAASEFIAVAKILGQAVESFRDALHILANTKHGWLLVLDNADDPEFDYSVYLPSGSHGAIIMTSRVSECRKYSPDDYEALEGLEDQYSIQLLLRAAGLPENSWSFCHSQAQEVVRLLGSHTLALIQSGAYVAKGHCRLHQYSEVYQRQRKRLLMYQPKQAQSRYCDVYATFEASAEVLEHSKSEAAHDALLLVTVLSMLDSSALPLQIFEDAWKGGRKVLRTDHIGAKEVAIEDLTQAHVLRLPNFMALGSDKWDPYQLFEAISLLVSLSLVVREDSDGLSTLSMHPLTHAWAKDRQDSEQQGAAWITAGCILALSRSNPHLWQTQERRLLPHMQSYLNIHTGTAFSFGSKVSIIPILLYCGWALSDMRQDSRLASLLEDVFSQLGEHAEIPSQASLPIYDLQAKSLQNLGRSKKAGELLEHMVEIRQSTLSKDHPFRLASQYELAIAYRSNRQIKEAVDMLEQVVQIRQSTLAKDHPFRLALQHELAIAYCLNRQIKEAVEMLEQVVAIKQDKLRQDHPSRVVSEEVLAYFLQGT